MSNANMPAMPQSVSRSDDGAVISSCDFVGCEGLTKREYFAGLAMQGAMSRQGSHLFCDIADESVRAADALLKRLDEECGQ